MIFFDWSVLIFKKFEIYLKKMPILGIYPENFIGKYINRSKSFECCYCHLVSPKNYIIECSHCICQTCILNHKFCTICIDKEIHKSGENPTAFQFISTEIIINPYRIRCIFNPCQWKGTYKDFIKNHYEECEFKGDKKLMDEYFEEFVEDEPPKINKKSKSEIKTSKRKKIESLCNISKSFDENDYYDEKSFNYETKKNKKSNNYTIINQKNNYNIINNNKHYYDSKFNFKPSVILLKEKSVDKNEKSEIDEIPEQNENEDIISLNEGEEKEEEEDYEDNESRELYYISNEESDEKENKNNLISDDKRSFKILDEIKEQNNLKEYREININLLKQKRKNESTNFNFYNENHNNNIYGNDFSLYKNNIYKKENKYNNF